MSFVIDTMADDYQYRPSRHRRIVRGATKAYAYDSSGESVNEPPLRPCRRKPCQRAMTDATADATHVQPQAAETPSVLIVHAGLCNRLRALCSYRRLAIAADRTITIIWEPREECPGRFADLFEPLHGATIVDDMSRDGAEPAHDFHASVKMRRDAEASCLADLVPCADIRDQIGRVVSGCGPRFIALHIRRTDHHAFEILKHTPDEEFERFADRFPDHVIFLATDNADTQRRFVARYGVERVRLVGRIPTDRCWRDAGCLRLTPLRDAVVDLFTCVEAAAFKGSTYSSFSDTVAHLRASRGTASTDDEHEILEPFIDFHDDFEALRHRPEAGAFRRQGGLRKR